MGWSYFLCHTRTGERFATVEPVSYGSWSHRVDYKSGGSHDFHVAEYADLWRMLLPGQVTLVVCWDDTPVYAGVIWSASYQLGSDVVSLSHNDVWSLWDRRLAAPQFRSTETSQRVIQTRRVYEGLDLRTHIKRVIQLGMIGPARDLDSYQLPVILPDDRPGPHRFERWTYDFQTVSDAIMEIVDRDDAPMVYFRPEWHEYSFRGNLQWRLVTVDEPAGDMILHPCAPRSAVTSLSMDQDMSEWASEVHVTGEGSETGTLHRRRWAGDVQGPHFVALAHHEAASDLKTTNQVTRAAHGLYQQRRTYTTQTEVTVHLGDEGYSIHDFSLGSRIIVRVDGDPVIPDGEYERVLIGYSPAGVDALKLELAPVTEPMTGITDE